MATTLADLTFQQHPSGVGFEARTNFQNGHQLLIVCGPSVYVTEGADIEIKQNALDYTTFQYLYIGPFYEGRSIEDWMGPLGPDAINEKIAEVEEFPEVATEPPGGMGTDGAGVE